MPAYLALAVVAQATAMPAIKVMPAPNNELVVQIEPFEETRLAEMKDAAARAMASACAGRPIGWGNLIYRGSVDRVAPTQVIDYRQTFRCLDLDPKRYPHAPADWKPAAADEAAASRELKAYFEAIDAGALEQAFGMMEAHARGPRDEWMANQQIGRRLLAGKGERTLTGMRWFNDPPEAPYPGIFVRLTFAGRFPRVPVYCGSMVLYRAAPDAYVVAGVTEHILSEEDRPDSNRIAEYQAQFCE